jgi:hypothetical protein
LIPPKTAPAALSQTDETNQTNAKNAKRQSSGRIHFTDEDIDHDNASSELHGLSESDTKTISKRGKKQSKKKIYDGQSLGEPSSSLSGISSPTQSYHNNMVARWNPPLCYSKKPIFEQMLQEQKLLKQQKTQILEEVRNSLYLFNQEEDQDEGLEKQNVNNDKLPVKPLSGSLLQRSKTTDMPTLRPRTSNI